MATDVKIFIDANWFLAFYQSADEPTAILQELALRADRIILTEQVIDEVVRNRGQIIATLRRNVAKSLEVTPFTTSVMRALPQFKELLHAREALREAAKATLDAIDTLHRGKDPVADAFESLVHSSKKIQLTPEIVKAAHVRKLRGQPPTTPGRDSIGDEINWEALATECKEDLVIVTLDRDYLDHVALLTGEYRRRSGRHLLRVSDRLAPILKEFGERSPAIEEAERSVSAWARCDNCGALDWEPHGERDETYDAVRHTCGNCGNEIWIT